MKIGDIYEIEENVWVPAGDGESNHKALKDNRDAVISGMEEIISSHMTEKDTQFLTG